MTASLDHTSPAPTSTGTGSTAGPPPAAGGALRTLFWAAVAYMVVGVGSGLFYREFTKLNGFPEGQFTQLGLAHTHLLTLGFIVLLIVMVVERVFVLSRSRKLFAWFFWLYNLGVVLTSAMLVWHGSLTVVGQESTKMISGIAGLGHMLITAGMIVFFVALHRALAPRTTPATAAPQAVDARA